MKPISALTIATATTQFPEQSIKVFKALYDYEHDMLDASLRSRELQNEIYIISNLLIDLRFILTSTSKSIQIPKSATSLMEIVKEFTKVMIEMIACIEVKKREIIKQLK